MLFWFCFDKNEEDEKGLVCNSPLTCSAVMILHFVNYLTCVNNNIIYYTNNNNNNSKSNQLHLFLKYQLIYEWNIRSNSETRQ